MRKMVPKLSPPPRSYLASRLRKWKKGRSMQGKGLDFKAVEGGGVRQSPIFYAGSRAVMGKRMAQSELQF